MTTWGEYVVTGTFDGHTLTLTEPPVVDNSRFTPRPEPTFPTACPAPAGGWRPTDLAKATEDGKWAASEMAYNDPDFGGAWTDDNVPPTDPPAMEDPTKLVLNFRFTKDLARHEAELRTVWGGALCVAQRQAHEDRSRHHHGPA